MDSIMSFLSGLIFTMGIHDGCLFHHPILICWRHLVSSKESSNHNYFSEKTYYTSYLRNMFWATILYKYHDVSPSFNWQATPTLNLFLSCVGLMWLLYLIVDIKRFVHAMEKRAFGTIDLGTKSNFSKLLIVDLDLVLHVQDMVFMLDGCSFYYAHIWSKSGVSICWRHLGFSEKNDPVKVIFTA